MFGGKKVRKTLFHLPALVFPTVASVCLALPPACEFRHPGVHVNLWPLPHIPFLVNFAVSSVIGGNMDSSQSVAA